MPLRLRYECVQRIAQRAEPQSVVDHLRPLLRNGVLEPRDLLGQGDVLQRLVRLEQDHRGRGFVDLTRLDSDQSILEVVDAPDAVLAAKAIESRDDVERGDGLAVQRDGHALLEPDLDVRRLVWTVARVPGPCVDIPGGLGPWVFENACLDRTSPEVFVRRVRLTDGGRHLDAVLVCVLDLIVATHAPLADRRDHLQVGGERGGGDGKAHLVVALSRAAMRNGLSAFPASNLDHHRGDERPAQRGREWIFLFVHRAGLQRRPDEKLKERDPSVGDVGRGGAGLQRAHLDRVEVLLLAEVDGERDHVPALVFEPADGDGRVEPARVGEHQPSIRHQPADA